MAVKSSAILTLIRVNDGEDGNDAITVSPTAPSNPVTGQLWQTASGNPIKRWDGSKWVTDTDASPCINAGNPASDYANEPEPNGNRINMGVFGNTFQASKTGNGSVQPTTNPAGGETTTPMTTKSDGETTTHVATNPDRETTTTNAKPTASGTILIGSTTASEKETLRKPFPGFHVFHGHPFLA